MKRLRFWLWRKWFFFVTPKGRALQKQYAEAWDSQEDNRG